MHEFARNWNKANRASGESGVVVVECMAEQPKFLSTALATVPVLGRSRCPIWRLIPGAIALCLIVPVVIATAPPVVAQSNQPAKPESAKPESAKPESAKPDYIRPRVTCPENVATLTPALLRDLPNYMNRQYLRSLRQRPEGRTYAVLASQPELEPLPTVSDEYDNPVDHNLHQVFFTVLERQYSGQTIAELQHYHWLFLTRTQDGWRIALMFSRLGQFPAGQQPVTPPVESSQGLTAQAVRAWLRDCQAGAVRL